ncbi:MAG: hypothetical protein WC707_00610 [Candidatus Babeliaceae bacterium]|jgi:hypothetical protein
MKKSLFLFVFVLISVGEAYSKNVMCTCKDGRSTPVTYRAVFIGGMTHNVPSLEKCKEFCGADNYESIGD